MRDTAGWWSPSLIVCGVVLRRLQQQGSCNFTDSAFVEINHFNYVALMFMSHFY